MANFYGSTTPAGITGVTPVEINTSLRANIASAAGGQLTHVRYYTPDEPPMGYGVTMCIIPTNDTQNPVALWETTLDTAPGWHSYPLPTAVAMTPGLAYQLIVAWGEGQACGWTYSEAPTLPVSSGDLTISGVGEVQDAGYLWFNAALTGGLYYVDAEVSTGPPAFTVDAGADHAITDTQTVSLEGSSANGVGAVTYAWTQVSGVAGTFSDAASATSSWSPSAAGTAVLQLSGNDGVTVATDTVTVTVAVTPQLDFAAVVSNAWPTVVGASALDALSDDDDATYVRTSDDPEGEILALRLPALDKPAGDLTVRVRPSSTGGPVTMTATLRNAADTALLATATAPVVTSSATPAWESFTWSAASLVSVTDWASGLIVRLTAG